MPAFTHIRTLQHIFQYASPKGCYHEPRAILPGFEEIEVIVAGRGLFLVDGAFRDVGPGEMLWYHEGEIVEVTSDAAEPYNTIVFVYETAAPQPVVERQPMVACWDNADACARFCLHALDVFRSSAMDRQTLAACTYARLQWESRTAARAANPFGQKHLVMQAMQCIREHYLRPFGTRELAQRLDISESSLHQLFRRHMQKSPMQVILEQRLERARLLLATTAMSIKEVARESGFAGFNHFCRTFRLKTGCTAQAFRANALH